MPDRYPTDLWVARFYQRPQLIGDDDVQEAGWFPVKDVLSGKIKLAFNHNKLVRMAYIEYQDIRNA